MWVLEENQRKTLHLAAVFACNFSNQMYYIAEDLLKKSDFKDKKDYEVYKMGRHGMMILVSKAAFDNIEKYL